MKQAPEDHPFVEDVTAEFETRAKAHKPLHMNGEWFDSCDNGQDAREQEQPPRTITATPYVWCDPSTIPRRQWLYGNHYIRKFVSTTMAPGGLGKTSLVLVEAMAMASGKPLLGVGIPKKLRVWYWNGEDPQDEVERRVAAILLHFKIDPKEVEGFLFLDNGRDTPIRMAAAGRDGVKFTPDAKALTSEIIERKIDVFIADPFVKTHGVPENDNGAIDQVTTLYAAIADAADCSIELTHHVRKLSNGRGEVTVDDGRGAGSLKDASRSVRVLNVMTAEETKTAGVKEKDRRLYFRSDLGKENMQPPAEAATWFKLVSVLLNNDDASGPGRLAGLRPTLARLLVVQIISVFGRRLASQPFAGVKKVEPGDRNHQRDHIFRALAATATPPDRRERRPGIWISPSPAPRNRNAGFATVEILNLRTANV